MKHAATRPFADPEMAARKLLEIANATEAVQDGPHLHRDDQRPVLVQGGRDTGGVRRRCVCRKLDSAILMVKADKDRS